MTRTRHIPVISFRYSHIFLHWDTVCRHSGPNGHTCLDLPNIFISLAGRESLRKVRPDCTYTPGMEIKHWPWDENSKAVSITHDLVGKERSEGVCNIILHLHLKYLFFQASLCSTFEGAHEKEMGTFEFRNFARSVHSALLERTHLKKGCTVEPSLLKRIRIS